MLEDKFHQLRPRQTHKFFSQIKTYMVQHEQQTDTHQKKVRGTKKSQMKSSSSICDSSKFSYESKIISSIYSIPIISKEKKKNAPSMVLDSLGDNVTKLKWCKFLSNEIFKLTKLILSTPRSQTISQYTGNSGLSSYVLLFPNENEPQVLSTINENYIELMRRKCQN